MLDIFELMWNGHLGLWLNILSCWSRGLTLLKPFSCLVFLWWWHTIFVTIIHITTTTTLTFLCYYPHHYDGYSYSYFVSLLCYYLFSCKYMCLWYQYHSAVQGATFGTGETGENWQKNSSMEGKKDDQQQSKFFGLARLCILCRLCAK